jgi:alcohol dehydrogenase class IV
MIRQAPADALALVSTELKFGVGSFAEAGRLAGRLGRRAIVVTTRNAMERLGYAQELMADLRRQGIETCQPQTISTEEQSWRGTSGPT